MYKPPYDITNKILKLSISITEKIGLINAFSSLKRMPIKAKELGPDADIIRNITLYAFLTKVTLTKSRDIDINGITSDCGEKLRTTKVQE